jgi:hypothetical protein
MYTSQNHPYPHKKLGTQNEINNNKFTDNNTIYKRTSNYTHQYKNPQTSCMAKNTQPPSNQYIWDNLYTTPSNIY